MRLPNRLLVASLLPMLLLGAPQLPGPPGPVTLTAVAIGDTVTLRAAWGAGQYATSYNVTITVAATNGTWTTIRDSLNCNVDANCGRVPGAPLGVISSTPGLYRKTWVTAIPWDSATFTATVVSKNATGLSAAVSA